MRFMIFNDGEWVKFEKNVMNVLISVFANGKSMIEVEIEGFKLILNFCRMIGID